MSSVENITLVQVTTNTATITLADGNFVSTQAGVIDAAATAGVLTLDADAEDDSSLTIKGGTGADIITGTDATLSGSTVLGDTMVVMVLILLLVHLVLIQLLVVQEQMYFLMIHTLTLQDLMLMILLTSLMELT